MRRLVKNIKLIHGDCLNQMNKIPNESIDMILVDPPYGTTRCKWDSVIPLEPMWSMINRITKKDSPIIIFASQPFTTTLIGSNLKIFKYCWAWDKVNKFSGHLNAKKQPLRILEDIVVFYRKQPTYNPQMVEGKPYTAISSGRKSDNYGKQIDAVKTVNTGKYYPKNILSIKGDERGTVGRLHPTQKPVGLMEYLIKTYTNEGDNVLDFAMGSGTTGVACKKLNRNFIGIELDKEYFKIADSRINNGELI